MMAGTMKQGLDKIGDAIGGGVGKMNAATIYTSNEFVEQISIGNHYELEAARIALSRSASDAVRSFADQMVEDHTTAKHHLDASLAMNETADVPPPPEKLDTRREAMVRHLRDAPDSSFDSSYAEQQVLAHEETATLLRSYAQRGDNSQLQSFAQGTLPVVERHLANAKTLKERT